jgi:formate dehydrogenase iron-sulfur subunit
MTRAILVDVTRCVGCEQCVAACVRANGLDASAAEADRRASGDGLSAHRLCTVQELDGRFVRKSCLHCLEPSCVAACLVGAINKTADGPVVYDGEKCIGCRYCMLACPSHVPRYEWSETRPLMKKCSMCVDRLARGEQTACVAACPRGAIELGERESLLEKAKALVGRPGGRYLPRVWGEHEWGGTSVLYVSDVDLSPLGWPRPAAAAIPELTDPLIEKTPFIGGGVGLVLWGVGAIIQRRMRLMGSDHGKSADEEGDHGEESSSREGKD